MAMSEKSGVLVSIVMPCRDEEATIGECIKSALSALKKNRISGEIIVVDNSSVDSSGRIARALGARVVREGKVGYGAALMSGFYAARGKYIVMADSDGTYDFSEFPKLINKLEKGYSLVLGSRMKGRIMDGAMPFIRRRIGNPVLTFILNLFFGTKISDPHSGFRAFRRESLEKMALKTTGMELASEMIINSSKKGLRISEVPINYYPRKTPSKLKPVSDGWRHLRFMLMYSPIYLFMIPGLILLSLGMLFMALSLSSKSFEIRSLLGSLISLLGYQITAIGLYARTYAIISGFEPHDRVIDFIAKHFPLEKTIFLGSIIFLFSVALSILSFRKASINFSIFSLTFLVLGIQTIFSAFFLSVMLVEKKD
ncbi:MAG: glycosyltransferase family 2 protein [Candidatus Woesearchaeota archaeon]|nr:glycosyltransferase family 2 protein [Candidatus Woesearchaeota archaeon]